MINQYELVDFLHDSMPELNNKLVAGAVKSPYAVMDRLVKVTETNIREHRISEVKKCFEAVGRAYDKGNNIVKNAVENVYVYSFSTLLNNCGPDKKWILAIVPITLYTIYINQLQARGC